MNTDKTCYYCGAAATSGEHAPPKCIFPRVKDTESGIDYRKNLIKVPSCDLHNMEKSSDDEYLLHILAMCIVSNKIGQHHFLSRVQRALKRRPNYLDKVLHKCRPVTIHDSATNTWHETLAVKTDDERLTSIFTHIAKAVYFYEFDNMWSDQLCVSTEFNVSFGDTDINQKQTELSQTLDNIFSNIQSKGDNPDAFCYKFYLGYSKPILRLYFYGDTKVTIKEM